MLVPQKIPMLVAVYETNESRIPTRLILHLGELMWIEPGDDGKNLAKGRYFEDRRRMPVKTDADLYLPEPKRTCDLLCLGDHEVYIEEVLAPGFSHPVPLQYKYAFHRYGIKAYATTGFLQLVDCDSLEDIRVRELLRVLHLDRYTFERWRSQIFPLFPRDPYFLRNVQDKYLQAVEQQLYSV